MITGQASVWIPSRLEKRHLVLDFTVSKPCLRRFHRILEQGESWRIPSVIVLPCARKKQRATHKPS